MNHLLAPFKWIGKHWFLALLIVLFLYLVGTMLYYLFTFFKRIGEVAGKILPGPMAAAVVSGLTKIYNAVSDHTWVFIAVTFFIYAPLGLGMAIWKLVDKTKTTPIKATTTTDLIPQSTPAADTTTPYDFPTGYTG